MLSATSWWHATQCKLPWWTSLPVAFLSFKTGTPRMSSWGRMKHIGCGHGAGDMPIYRLLSVSFSVVHHVNLWRMKGSIISSLHFCWIVCICSWELGYCHHLSSLLGRVLVCPCSPEVLRKRSATPQCGASVPQISVTILLAISVARPMRWWLQAAFAQCWPVIRALLLLAWTKFGPWARLMWKPFSTTSSRCWCWCLPALVWPM